MTSRNPNLPQHYFVVPEFADIPSFGRCESRVSFSIYATYPGGKSIKRIESGIKTVARAYRRRDIWAESV